MNDAKMEATVRPIVAACLAALLLAMVLALPATAQAADASTPSKATQLATQAASGPAAQLAARAAGGASAQAAQLEAQQITYMPDVTEQMAKPSYWASKQADADALLADRETIDALNQAGVDGDGTSLQPLKTASGTYYDADKQQSLKNSTASELAYVLSNLENEPVYDKDWNLIDQAYVDAILANYPTDGTEPALASPYGIVTKHTTMRAYPTDEMMLYTYNDYDDDNLYLSMLRVNEPVIVREVSNDGKFYLCISSCLNAAWVPAEDVAICAGSEEQEAHDQWLDAWDIPAGKELVVYGYKVRTEQSRVTPNTADRMLYMGTVLESIDLESPEQALELVGTRSAYNRHVCYLPVRNDDGTYSKEVALIAESEKVSEGYLPLTTSGIASVAFNSLGQMYGWGGMLEANDCSGYVRDVYKCFGLELARNTTWQMNLPVRKYDLSGLDDAHKAAAIAQMPLGTVLFFSGHEMLYLGQENGKLYVINSLGSVGDIYGSAQASHQVKAVAINTLDMIRRNRTSWLTNLTCANIPYIPADPAGASLFDIAFYEGSITWPEASYAFDGKAIAPEVSIPGLTAKTDYTVEFANNDKPGTATVTVKGAGAYEGEVSRTFEIASATQAVTAKNVSKSFKANKKTGKLAANKTIDLKKAAKVNAKTSVSYAKANKAGGARIVVNAKTGKMTLKKGLKRGTYKVNVKITAAASAEYAAATKTITVTATVK